MPYIRSRDRIPLEPMIEELAERITNNEGRFNYVITRLAHRLASHKGGGYAALNATIGALECCKLEMYRRRVAPYEDIKVEENGDV